VGLSGLRVERDVFNRLSRGGEREKYTRSSARIISDATTEPSLLTPRMSRRSVVRKRRHFLKLALDMSRRCPRVLASAKAAPLPPI